MPKQMNLNEFKKAFAKLKKQGWVQSERKGSTGVGHTLERLLGLKENNIAVPDLGTVELKAHRIGSSSMISLFSFNRKAWKMKPLNAIRQYGTPDINGRMGLYFTMSRKPNSTGLFLYTEDEAISVRHVSGQVVAEWQLEILANRFIQKLPGLVLVSADSEIRGDIEWFKYERAHVLTGTSADIIRSQIWAGNVLFDIRLTTKPSSQDARFLARDSELLWLFKRCDDL